MKENEKSGKGGLKGEKEGYETAEKTKNALAFFQRGRIMVQIKMQ